MTANEKNNILKIDIKLMIWLILDFVLVLFSYWRAFLGIGLQDESYYVSLTLAQMDGNIPFAYDNYMWTQGSGFLMMPLIFAYKSVVGSTQGMFLFLRCCFVTFRLLVIYVLYRVVKRRAGNTKALMIISVLIPNMIVGCMQMFSYNTVYFWLSLLTASILFDVFENKVDRVMSRLFFAGFISGIFVFAHEVAAFVVIYFMIAIVIFSSEGKKWHNLLTYCVGGILEIAVVFVPIIAKTSLKEVVNGFYEKIFFQSNYGWWADGMPLNERLLETIKGIMAFAPLFCAVALFVFLFSRKYIRVEEKRFNKNEEWLFALGCGAVACFVCIVPKMDRFFYLSHMGAICCIFVVFYIAISRDVKLFIWFGIYPMVFMLAEVLFANTGDGYERVRFASAVIVPIIWILLDKNNKLLAHLASLMAIIVVIGTCYHDIKIIHTDEYISKLTSQVQSGVFKGIFTTKERAILMPEMEDYISSFLEEDDTYAFRDQVTFGALLANKGKLVDSRPWDYLDYANGNNNPNAAYHYYQMRNDFPKKIYYVDWNSWHMNPKLSIDKKDYLYNKWVNTYYEKIGEKSFGPVNDKYNEMVDFRVIVYSYKGGFDGDFQKWIDNAEMEMNTAR